MCSVEWYGPESASEIKPLQKTSLASASRDCETSYKGVEVQLLCAIKCDRQELFIAHSCNVRSLQMLEIPHEALYVSQAYVQAFGATNICNLAAMPGGSKIERCLMANHIDEHQTRSAFPEKAVWKEHQVIRTVSRPKL